MRLSPTVFWRSLPQWCLSHCSYSFCFTRFFSNLVIGPFAEQILTLLSLSIFQPCQRSFSQVGPENRHCLPAFHAVSLGRVSLSIFLAILSFCKEFFYRIGLKWYIVKPKEQKKWTNLRKQTRRFREQSGDCRKGGTLVVWLKKLKGGGSRRESSQSSHGTQRTAWGTSLYCHGCV